MIREIDRRIPDFLLSPQKRIYRHLLLQSAVFLITLNVFWDTPDKLILTPDRLWSWLGYLLVIDLLIYGNAYGLAPRFLLKGRWSVYLVAVCLLILASMVLLGGFQTLFEDTRFESRPLARSEILLNVVSSTISCGLLVAGSSALVLCKHWVGTNLRIGELEAATLQSELKFLKSQINPHFLFNMLNNVYVLIRKRRAEAAEVLGKLENLLRYQLADSVQEKIPLRSDIRFLTDFLKLEKLRRDRFDYVVSEEGDIDKVWVPPLLFIPFVENAVKHNADGEKVSYVHLLFRVEKNRLVFRSENSKAGDDEDDKGREGGGLGLKNIRRRLELVYPGRHTLEISDEKLCYKVNLELEL